VFTTLPSFAAAAGITPEDWYRSAAAAASEMSQAAQAAAGSAGAGQTGSAASTSGQQAVDQLLRAEQQSIGELIGRAAAAVAAVGQDGTGTRAAAAASGVTAPAEIDAAMIQAFINPPEEDITEGDDTAEDLVWGASPDLAEAAESAAAAGVDTDDEVEVVSRVVTLEEAKQAAETLLLYFQDNSTAFGAQQNTVIQQVQRMQDKLLDWGIRTAQQMGIDRFFSRVTGP